MALLPGPSHGAPFVDASQDLVQQSITYESPFTIITFKRSIFTGDMDDVAIRVSRTEETDFVLGLE